MKPYQKAQYNNSNQVSSKLNHCNNSKYGHAQNKNICSNNSDININKNNNYNKQQFKPYIPCANGPKCKHFAKGTCTFLHNFTSSNLKKKILQSNQYIITKEMQVENSKEQVQNQKQKKLDIIALQENDFTSNNSLEVQEDYKENNNSGDISNYSVDECKERKSSCNINEGKQGQFRKKKYKDSKEYQASDEGKTESTADSLTIGEWEDDQGEKKDFNYSPQRSQNCHLQQQHQTQEFILSQTLKLSQPSQKVCNNNRKEENTSEFQFYDFNIPKVKKMTSIIHSIIQEKTLQQEHHKEQLNQNALRYFIKNDNFISQNNNQSTLIECEKIFHNITDNIVKYKVKIQRDDLIEDDQIAYQLLLRDIWNI